MVLHAKAALSLERQIAEVRSMPLSMVSGILTRIGLGNLPRLEVPEPPDRYQRRHPGESFTSTRSVAQT
jgi:hypothetical protein